MSFNVMLTKILVEWADPDTEFPYTVTLFGIDVDDNTPMLLQATNSGATADPGTFITDSETAASWAIVN